MENKRTFREITGLIFPYRKSIVIISVIMLLTSIGSFITPWLTKQLIDVGIMSGKFNKAVYYILLTQLSHQYNW